MMSPPTQVNNVAHHDCNTVRLVTPCFQLSLVRILLEMDDVVSASAAHSRTVILAAVCCWQFLGSF
jgi:hypothetical protein